MLPLSRHKTPHIDGGADEDADTANDLHANTHQDTDIGCGIEVCNLIVQKTRLVVAEKYVNSELQTDIVITRIASWNHFMRKKR